LHDIGRLILLKCFSEQYEYVLKTALTSDQPLYALEKKCLGCRHTDVAKYLIKKWKLPPSLENTIYYHHRPTASQDAKKAAVVHFADMIAHGLGLGHSGETYLPGFDADAVDHLNLSSSSLNLVIKQALHQLDFLDSMFQEKALS
jgi:HD-like signal output (HDOD) protein